MIALRLKVEGIHNLIAALLVGDVGERDTVQVDQGEDGVLTIAGHRAVEGSATPIACLTG